MHEEALAVRRKAHGDKHQDVAQSLNNLALVLEMQVGSLELVSENSMIV